jgi:hypothetical protein
VIQTTDAIVEEMTLTVTLLTEEGNPLPALPPRPARFRREKATAWNIEAVTWEIGPEPCWENRGTIHYVECASPTGAVRTRLVRAQTFIEDATLTFLPESIVLDELNPGEG